MAEWLFKVFYLVESKLLFKPPGKIVKIRDNMTVVSLFELAEEGKITFGVNN